MKYKKHLFNNGLMESEGNYLDGKKDGEWIYYYNTKELQDNLNNYPEHYPDYIISKETIGYSIRYITKKLPEIIIQSKGSYYNGNKTGYWEEYFWTGGVSMKGNYKDGEKIGVWEDYNYRNELIKKINH